MTYQPELQHDLNILERIELDPETTQASLASQLGVAGARRRVGDRCRRRGRGLLGAISPRLFA